MPQFQLRRSTGVSPMRFYFALALLITLSLLTASTEAAEYKYPYHDPYLATATVAILSDDGATKRVDSTIVHVPGLPGRNNLPDLEGRGDVSLSVYRQSRPAPLLFILAGLGSTPFFGVAPYLASLYYREGFDVVILPSPLSWNFALSASRSGAPGYAPEDARDLYEVMQKTLTVLRDQHSFKPTSINFMAVSLGALEGAYLSVLDADEKKIGIDKYLLINPPVDLAYAIKKIDDWNRLADKFGQEKSRADPGESGFYRRVFFRRRTRRSRGLRPIGKEVLGIHDGRAAISYRREFTKSASRARLRDSSDSRSKGSHRAKGRNEKTP